MGTSTVTTRASRRALTKPTMVAASASVATTRPRPAAARSSPFQARQAGQPQDQQQRVAQHGEDEQRREQAHRDQPDPGDPVAPGWPRRGPGQHAQRDQDAGQRQRQHGRGRAGAVMQSVGNEAGADVEMGQRAQREKAQENEDWRRDTGGTGAPARQARSKGIAILCPGDVRGRDARASWLRQARGAWPRAPPWRSQRPGNSSRRSRPGCSSSSRLMPSMAMLRSTSARSRPMACATPASPPMAAA